MAELLLLGGRGLAACGGGVALAQRAEGGEAAGEQRAVGRQAGADDGGAEVDVQPDGVLDEVDV